ncbi:serine/threonine-protein kinase pakG isoform X2 [Battus philenor]|uniref:serine/threonine-protein kinase pakG isoform X2 n=1 Tax=Battus philenor TaxID=42288 RepID=UPI0035CF0E8A
MTSNRDEGPVYYREIQKNAFLKRIPNDVNTGKLRPLGHKKPTLKAMWTLFCVHNGRTPFLEQYPEPDSPATLTHRPAWRVCLKTARHVTASVKPHMGDEYDFLIDTEQGPVRMLAPDWDSMQDWVTTLRNKLHELKILTKGENVYCAAPVPPVPRAAARDPTSPLPPTPPIPPDRVPGIELTTPIARQTPETTSEPTTSQPIENPTQNPEPSSSEPVDISNWDDVVTSVPSTSQAEPKKSVAKICGQNICLDDSILKRNTEITDSDEEFFHEIDRIHESVENLCVSENGFTQRFVVSNDGEGTSSNIVENSHSLPQRTNITVIQVSNKGPPHTAIPVLGPDTDVFDFNFQQNVTISPDTGQNDPQSFVNIVNTEINVQNSNDSDYGTVFSKSHSDYGHLSLTTTVSLTGEAVKVTDDIYERLCMASTSTDKTASPLPVKKIKSMDKLRKSSLPNLELASESTYEYLYPNSSQNNNVRTTTNVTLNDVPSETYVTAPNGRSEINSNVNETRSNIINVTNTPIPPISTNLSSNTRSLRTNVERSHSQNAYDGAPRIRENFIRRIQNNSPKREAKVEKNEAAKPIWKRGLTELSLLSRLRGFGQGKRQDSPTRHETDNGERSVTSPVKVVHRSRPQGRVDSSRRRSNSLSNGQSPPRQGGVAGVMAGGVPGGVAHLAPLRARQAAALRAEQRRGSATATALSIRDPPVFADYEGQVWCDSKVGG